MQRNLNMIVAYLRPGDVQQVGSMAFVNTKWLLHERHVFSFFAVVRLSTLLQDYYLEYN